MSGYPDAAIQEANHMDITAPSGQPAESLGEGSAFGSAKPVELAADPCLSLAEFQGLADASGHPGEELLGIGEGVKIDHKPPVVAEEKLDVISEILGKMTGITAAVSPRNSASFVTDDTVIPDAEGFAAEGLIPDIPPPLQEAAPEAVDGLTQVLPSVEGIVEVAEKSETAPLVLRGDVTKQSEAGPDTIPQDADIVAATLSAPRRPDVVGAFTEKQVRSTAKGGDTSRGEVLPEAAVSPRIVVDNDKASLPTVFSGESNGSELGRSAAFADSLLKPSSVISTEPKAIVTGLSPVDSLLSEASSIRTQPELRQPQINPPAVFRQITDTVVTMRDEMVEIRLSPEELGRVRMVLTGQDRTPHLTIWVDRPEVLEQMRRQSDALLQQLRDQGMSGASLDFRDGRQSPANEDQDLGFDGGQDRDSGGALLTMIEPSKRSLATPSLSGRYGIDIRV